MMVYHNADRKAISLELYKIFFYEDPAFRCSDVQVLSQAEKQNSVLDGIRRQTLHIKGFAHTSVSSFKINRDLRKFAHIVMLHDCNAYKNPPKFANVPLTSSLGYRFCNALIYDLLEPLLFW